MGIRHGRATVTGCQSSQKSDLAMFVSRLIPGRVTQGAVNAHPPALEKWADPAATTGPDAAINRSRATRRSLSTRTLEIDGLTTTSGNLAATSEADDARPCILYKHKQEDS